MEFKFATGGRENYFKGQNVGDCVTRAICNASGKDYKEVYDRLFVLTKTRRYSKRERHYRHESPRNGVFTRVAKKYIEQELGWVWVPCMGIGTGCQVHLDEDELPKTGNYILNLSHHFTCIKDGVLYDTYDCSRDGNRCVYGYWREPTQEEKQIHEDTLKQVQDFKDFERKQKEELALRKQEVKKYNDKVTKKYAKRINTLKKQLRKLERERDSQLLEMPKLQKDAWAKYCLAREWDENGEYDREGLDD